MAKRGETRPWRVRFLWRPDGPVEEQIEGIDTFTDQDRAVVFVDELKTNADRRDLPILISVTNRDTPYCRVIRYLPNGECATCGHTPWAHGDQDPVPALGAPCHADVDGAECDCPTGFQRSAA